MDADDAADDKRPNNTPALRWTVSMGGAKNYPPIVAESLPLRDATLADCRGDTLFLDDAGLLDDGGRGDDLDCDRDPGCLVMGVFRRGVAGLVGSC